MVFFKNEKTNKNIVKKYKKHLTIRFLNIIFYINKQPIAVH